MLITTTHGEMEESALVKREQVVSETVAERTTAIEYYLAEELVHRSVNVTLKKGAEIGGALAEFG